MARYSVNNLMAGSQQVLATTNKAIIGVNAATGATTLRRGWIDEIEVGADGAAVATDCQIDWTMAVQTAAGTGTAATPQPTPDGADAAALLTYTVNYTADPTYTQASAMLAMATNQRQGQRIAFPDFRLTPFIVAATNLKGITAAAKSTNYNSTVVIQEYCVE
ncbi:MAG: hypothetical protein HRJ53_11725 [Acidobacteria bacterium Pan2503]|jgi:hypothetical protein|uniref:Uncharacterized protein n=1 Tax=Candidatus Acidiferrum panamense TaxID=2741543 RepID=A0A7V8NQS4_9BACT|nr:hypothetical protein [Candidatus Acidoferrum panamensis]